jgi:hypothetical protein
MKNFFSQFIFSFRPNVPKNDLGAKNFLTKKILHEIFNITHNLLQYEPSLAPRYP